MWCSGFATSAERSHASTIPTSRASSTGGTTEDGPPYFVMDHVDGVPIDVYCDAARLTVNSATTEAFTITPTSVIQPTAQPTPLPTAFVPHSKLSGFGR